MKKTPCGYRLVSTRSLAVVTLCLGVAACGDDAEPTESGTSDTFGTSTTGSTSNPTSTDTGGTASTDSSASGSTTTTEASTSSGSTSTTTGDSGSAGSTSDMGSTGSDDGLAASSSDGSTTSLVASETGGSSEGDGSSTGAIAGSCTDPSWWNVAYSHRARMEIANDVADEPIYNFPVLVRLDPRWFDYAAASATGDDLRFRSDDGRFALNYEIDHWNPDGESAVWVEYPQLPLGDGETTGLWLYYGNPDASPMSNGAEVFDRYVTVNHLSEERLDSVGHHDADPDYFGNPSLCDGECEPLVGQAQSFDASQNDALLLADSERMTFAGNRERLSASIWVRTTSLDRIDGWTPILSKAETSWRIQQHANETYPSLDFDCIEGIEGPRCGEGADDFDNYHVAGGPGNIADGDWHLIAITFDYARDARWVPVDRPLTARIYLDGQMMQETVFAGSPAEEDLNSYPAAIYNPVTDVPISLAMKADQPSGNFFNGELDELRLSIEAFNPSWFRAEYEITRGDALTVEAVEQCPPAR